MTRSGASSYSSNFDCVEVALSPDTTAIRDSKAPDGPHLTIPPQQWQHFLSGLRDSWPDRWLDR